MTIDYSDFNTMTISDIMSIEGIGEKTAKRIIAMRPYRASDDLFKVRGLGSRTLNRIGIKKSKKVRRKWYMIDGEEYPLSAVAKDVRDDKIDLFWRIPREHRCYLETETSV